jgi:hypothetical protein
VLRITHAQDHDPIVTLKLEGKLVGPWVTELSRFCTEPPCSTDRVLRIGCGAAAGGASMTNTTTHAAGSAAEASNTSSSNPHSSEALLLERIRAGDEGACEVLVRQLSGRMLAVARQFLRSEEDSADAVQDAFLSAFRSLESFAGTSTLGT